MERGRERGIEREGEREIKVYQDFLYILLTDNAIISKNENLDLDHLYSEPFK